MDNTTILSDYLECSNIDDSNLFDFRMMFNDFVQSQVSEEFFERNTSKNTESFINDLPF
jgi:hypothetical protein